MESSRQIWKKKIVQLHSVFVGWNKKLNKDKQS